MSLFCLFPQASVLSLNYIFRDWSILWFHIWTKISVLLIGRQKNRSMVLVQITAILKLISQVHSSAIFPIPIEIGNLSMPEFWCQRTPVRPPVQTIRKGKGEFCKEGNVALLERANGVVPVKVSFVWLTSRKTYFLALSRSSSSLPLGMFRERRLSVLPVSILSEHYIAWYITGPHVQLFILTAFVLSLRTVGEFWSRIENL